MLQHASQGKEGVYLPFDSGEVLSGYLAYADYPNLTPWDCRIEIKLIRQMAKQPGVCAVRFGKVPNTHSSKYTATLLAGRTAAHHTVLLKHNGDAQ